MRRRRIAAGLVGVVFGVTLSWAGMSSPVVLREGLLLRNSYLFLFFASAVFTAFIGLRLLKVLEARTLLTGERVAWEVVKPERRHVIGAALFGTGWAIADACPGPVATQLGQGVPWALATAAGLVGGVLLSRQVSETTVDANV